MTTSALPRARRAAVRRTFLSLLSAIVLLPLVPDVGAEEAPRCLYVEVAALPIRYIGQSLEPAIEGTIDGTPATMLVDTGSYQTLLTMTAATRRDLTLNMTGRYAEGIGGISRIYATRLKEFSAGPAKSARRPTVQVIGDTGFTPSFDAIVGAPFLLQADLEVDLQARQMRFFRPLDCDKTVLAIWKEEMIALPFERSDDNSPNPRFLVTVNGKQLEALIDTGAGSSFLTLGAARRLGIDVGKPGVTRLSSAVGVGSERAARWRTPVKSIEIGDETIRDVELEIVESQGRIGADLYLGQDFLRAHRVLFAMSQRKLYIAYLGGDVFPRAGGLQPWMRAEAEAGNPDAQFRLALAYANGGGIARDPAQGRAWLEKAAAGGQPHAALQLGRQQAQAGQLEAAIRNLRAALDRLPAERLGPLWLFNARVRNGEAALAASELEAHLKRQKDDGWPEPVARFYLGKLDASSLLDEAGKEKKFARGRSCMANAYMAEWHAARGEKAQADSLMASVRAHCGPAQPAAPAKQEAPAEAPAQASAAQAAARYNGA